RGHQMAQRRRSRWLRRSRPPPQAVARWSQTANSSATLSPRRSEVHMHIGSVLLVIWLIIGAIAAEQRGYYSGTIGSCTKAGTIAVTILAGPLNYMGVNPKINCTVPQPSK